MPNSIDTAAARIVVPLVSFFWGDDPVHHARYVGMADDFITDDEEPLTYHSLTKMEVKPVVSGGTIGDSPNETPYRLTMAKVPPLDLLVAEPHAPVGCTIELMDPLDPPTRRVEYTGFVELPAEDPDGRPGLVQFSGLGWRSRFTMSLGILVAETCQNIFGNEGGSPCKYNLALIRQTGTVTGITRNEVTIAGVTAPPPQGMWPFGELYYDGLGMEIRNAVAVTGGTKFSLERQPPIGWVGKTIRCTPGCDRRLNTCRTVYNNEGRFNGTAVVMPNQDRTKSVVSKVS
jgi:hypothetical protein